MTDTTDRELVDESTQLWGDSVWFDGRSVRGGHVVWIEHPDVGRLTGIHLTGTGKYINLPGVPAAAPLADLLRAGWRIVRHEALDLGEGHLSAQDRYARTHVPESQIVTRDWATLYGQAPSQYPAHAGRMLATAYTLLLGRAEQAGVIVDRDTFHQHADQTEEPRP